MPTKTTTTTVEVSRAVEMTPLALDDLEPALGSVLLLSSTTGTAVQRFYSDGLYHATTGQVFDTFAAMFTDSGGKPRQVFLLHEPLED